MPQSPRRLRAQFSAIGLVDEIGGLEVIPDIQGDIIVDALSLLRRAGDALGELSRQRPQVGRKDDVGRFLAGVELGLLRGRA